MASLADAPLLNMSSSSPGHVVTPAASSSDTRANPQHPEDADLAENGVANDHESHPNGSGPQSGTTAPTEPPTEKLPTRKDASLREFLGRMDEYAPIIPDAVTNYYMTRAGLPPPPQTDQRLARLLALATQKFVADVAADAYQYSRIRASNSTSTAANFAGGAGGIGVVGAGGNMLAAGGGAQASQLPVGGLAMPKDAMGGGGRAGGVPLGTQRPGYGGGGAGGSQNRTVLTMEDLGMAVAEFGVNVKRSEFYR